MKLVPDYDENMALRYIMPKKIQEMSTTSVVIGATHQHHEY